ncbi:MAG: hypothetical protein WC655_27925 [Candidatus Hydrogenedentales bacterium]|jgi:hypothetical protein
MTLYNIRSDGDEYRITKFTNDLDVESSYLTSHTECQCPAGSRPTCRHRQMLPTMLDAGLLDTGGFYDFESGQVLLPVTDESDAMGNGEEYIDNPIVERPRPSFVEGVIGITAEELAAQIPTYEQVITEIHSSYELSEPQTIIEHDKIEDKPHPHLPKIDRRI